MNTTNNKHMRHALVLGARGLGRVWPNPAVGCVIVNDGRIVGRGWTGDGGRPHAETIALAQAGKLSKGATAYVTLEPCSHHGKTPPCVDALIDAGIIRVVIATDDPDPRVSGQGVERLKSAGIDVTIGVLEYQAKIAHQGFLSRIVKSRPMVTLKLAASFDGRIATQTGESQWITGPDARRMVHAMRASHDAVMVGGGTARADDPALNVRDIGVEHQPVRVVWSRHLDIPLQGKLAQTAREIPLWVLHTEDANPDICQAWQGLGARLFPCASNQHQIDPQSAMQALGDAGLTRVFCEGGGTLAASLLSCGLVDELVIFTAGIGIGAEGQPMLGAMGLDRLSKAPRFELVETRNIGADTMTRWRAA